MHLNVLWFAPLPIALLADAIGSNSDLRLAYHRTRSSDQQFEQLLDGSVDIAVTAMDNLVEWNRRAPHASFRAIAQVERSTELMIFGRPGINDIHELQGARLLIDAPRNGFAVALYALLAASGITADGCEIIPAGGVTERLEALLSGNGEATLLGPPFDLTATEAGCKMLARVSDVWPHFPGQGLVVANSRREEMTATHGAWLSGLDQALALSASAPQIALALLENSGLAPQFAARAMAALPSSLRPDRAGIDLLIEHRRMIGFPGHDLTYQNLVDLSFFD